MVPFVAGIALAVVARLVRSSRSKADQHRGCSAGGVATGSAAAPGEAAVSLHRRAADVGEGEGQVGCGQGAWRVRRAGARSGHRTCCWARPGSCRWGTLERRVRSGGPRLAGWRGPDAETDACPIGEAGIWGMVPSVGEECWCDDRRGRINGGGGTFHRTWHRGSWTSLRWPPDGSGDRSLNVQGASPHREACTTLRKARIRSRSFPA